MKKEVLIKILDNLPFGVAYIDRNNILQYFNETMEKEYKYSRSRIGKDAIFCHLPENQEKVRKMLEAFKTNQCQKFSRVYITKTRKRKLLTEYIAIYKGNEYFGALCTIKDLTNL